MTETRRPGMSGVLDDANTQLALPESVQMRERQKAALAVTFIAPSKRGAPVKYDNDTMPQRVFDWLTNREVIFTKKMIAGRLGVDVSTLRVWQSKYNDLSASIAQGLAEQEGWLASQMAGGMKYSASMYAVLKNLHDWKETVENTHKLGIGEALEQQRTGAKRVDWDRSRPDPLAPRGDVIDVDAQPRGDSGQPDAHAAPPQPDA